MENSKILIIEDERIIAEDIKRTLVNFKFEVVGIFSTGIEAIQKAEELKPDLILMDIMLEGKMTGIEAAGLIKDKFSIPIIYLTAYANKQTLDDAKITEPFGYIIKPFEERELNATIEMAFYRYKINKKLEAKSKQQQLLLESASHLTSSLDVTEVLTQIAKNANNLLSTYTCCIYLLEDDKYTLTPVVVIDPDYKNEVLATKLTIDNSFTGQAVTKKKCLIFNDAIDRESGLQIPNTDENDNECLIVAPFIADSTVLGAMCLSRQNIDFTEEDKTLAIGFATYAATALKNAQTHRELQSEIEERRITEQKLDQTQIRLASIFANTPDIVLYEKFGGRAFLSDNVKNLLGYDADDLISRKIKFGSIVHKQDYDLISKKFKTWFDSESMIPLSLWYRATKKDGSSCWIEDRMAKIIDDKGKKYISGVLIDFTALKKAENALRDSESRYKAVVEDQSEYINRYLPDGTITFVNQAFCRYVGKEESELLGSNWMEDLKPEYRQNILQRLNNLTVDNPVTSFVYDKTMDDNSHRYTEWIYRAIYDKNNDVKQYQAIGKNVSERIIAEQEKEALQNQLFQSQKMEVIGRLAGGIAHDFNNLLTTINGRSAHVLKKIEKSSPLYHEVETISECGTKAANLTRQLLAFSRKQIVTPKFIDLNNTMIEMEKIMRRLIGEDVILTTYSGNDLCTIKADQSQIEQIIINFIVNARDAMPEGGELILETSNVYINKTEKTIHDIVTPGYYVQLRVKDNGTGILDEDIEHIFEPFFTTKDQGKGTGLGLATVFGIVKQSEGSILVDSKLGIGTEIKVLFPSRDEAPESIITKDDEENLQQGSETILLTEDEPSIREFVGDILEEYGYKVLSAEDGYAAMRIAREYKEEIHLLLSDVVMPNMNGQKLAQNLHEIFPETAILFMSGHTESVALKKGILEDKTNFLQKPFTATSLITKIQGILSKLMF